MENEEIKKESEHVHRHHHHHFEHMTEEEIAHRAEKLSQSYKKVYKNYKRSFRKTSLFGIMILLLGVIIVFSLIRFVTSGFSAFGYLLTIVLALMLLIPSIISFKGIYLYYLSDKKDLDYLDRHAVKYIKKGYLDYSKNYKTNKADSIMKKNKLKRQKEQEKEQKLQSE